VIIRAILISVLAVSETERRSDGAAIKADLPMVAQA
jgi:hypothetical protein